MFINPIQFGTIGQFGNIGNIGNIGSIREQKPAEQESAGAGFSDVFKSAWNAAEDSQQDLAQKQYLMSVGELDDLHSLPIAQGKAELSLSLLVGLRNKALDSYNELMRMNV